MNNNQIQVRDVGTIAPQQQAIAQQNTPIHVDVRDLGTVRRDELYKLIPTGGELVKLAGFEGDQRLRELFIAMCTQLRYLLGAPGDIWIDPEDIEEIYVRVTPEERKILRHSFDVFNFRQRRHAGGFTDDARQRHHEKRRNQCDRPSP